jgi:uncharacterized protein (DUF1684 family)
MRIRRTQFLALGLLAVSSAFAGAGSAQQADFAKEEAAWRESHVADLKKPDGWLSLIGLEWMTPGENAVGSAADNKIRLPKPAPEHLAILKFQNNEVTLLAPKEGFPAGLTVDGAPATERVLRADPDKDKLNSRVTLGTISFYVVRRADETAVRVKDSESPTLREFHALNWYEPDAKFRVTAKWVPFSPQKTVTLARLVGKSYSLPVPGYAEFSVGGKILRLEPVLEDPKVAKLFFILRDATSSETTYPACRFLYTGFPDHGIAEPGELVLDFNHLENPPCAYTSFATCPLPPAGNRLPVALPVGEKRYHD